MAKTRLGIDMGTNSIGWMLYELDKNGEISEVLKAGVRIFPDGREDKSKASKNAARRVARMNRRQRDRYLQRRTAILRYLVKFGLMPEDKIEQRKLQDIDPYSIRAKAMEEEIPPHHLGRAIFHISQRRGYKSSRRNEENDKDGPVKNSIEEFRRQLGDKSVGQFLSELHQENKPIRARRDGVTNNDLFHYFPDRELIEKEFKDIWQKQQQIRSQQPDKNKQILSDILTNENKQTLFEVIFTQRPLKPPIIGNCQFFPTEKRIAKALPSFQRFRILQDINNLKYFDENEWHPLSPSIRDWALRILFAGGNLTFKKLKSQTKKVDEINESAFFNLEDEKCDDIKGEFTTKTMKKIISAWDEWDLYKQDSMISLLIGYEIIDEYKMLDELSSRYNLSKKEAQECANANIDNRQGVSGRASLSLEAINILMPYLEKGKRYDEALAESKIEKDKPSKHDDYFDMRPYPEILKQWCLPRPNKDESKEELRIPNPTVHVALNQLRAVVNDCIRINGGEKPSQVVVELARDLPIGIATRQKIRNRQLENKNARAQRRNKIEELGRQANTKSMLRMQLWEESSPKNANNRCCLYCGKQISCAAAVSSPDFEIDHILPFSKTLDDSAANKTLCCVQCNRDKGNKTPYEAWGSDEKRYEEIKIRASALSPKKRRRFLPDAMKHFDGDNDFLARQLTDTQYIAKVTKRYFESIIKPNDVYVIPGRLTGILRRKWGLNNILNDDGHKNRDDHRHHAVDAAVIGATTRSTLQKFATEAGKDNADLPNVSITAPMKAFREKVENAVKNIVVSHKPDHFKDGVLHSGTAYGFPADYKEGAGAQLVRHRIMLSKITTTSAQKVVNPFLREELKTLCDDYVADKKSFAQELKRYGEKNNIRRVLIEEKLSVIAVCDKDGKPYKGYKSDSNWAYEIFEKFSNGNWDGEIISTFNANQEKFTPIWKEKNPHAKFIMRLHKNDMVALDDNGLRKICYVTQLSAGKIVMVEHFSAVSDKNPPTIITKSPNEFRKINGRKIHISPGGLVRDTKKDGRSNH